MAVSLLRDWCRGLDVDTHRALLVTGIPEGLEQAAIEAVLQPALLPLGTFRLWNTRAARDHKAKAALVEFVQDINHASVPREIPGKDGVWRVVCQDPAEDPRVLRHMRRLVLDDRPWKATGPWAPENTLPSPAKETQAQGSEPTAKRAGPPPRRGRRARRNRARGNRWAPRGQSTEGREQPPTSARRESEASSKGSLSIVLEELDQDDLSADEALSALSTTLHQAARELSTKEWALQGRTHAREGTHEFLALVTVTDEAKQEPTEKEASEPQALSALSTTLHQAARELSTKEWALQGRTHAREGTHEFLALVTVTDEAKQEPTEKEASEPQAVSLDSSGGSSEARSRVPDLVALLAVRDAGDEEPVDGDAPEGQSQPNGEPGDEELDHPEFVAIVASTDPSDPSAREELLKIASVIASLGWRPRTDPTDTLGEVLSVLCQDTGGARVQVQDAGRRVDGLVLRKATGGGSLRECVCALAAPDPLSPGRRAPWGLLAGWGDGEGGLLELVALLAARDTAGVTAEGRVRLSQDEERASCSRPGKCCRQSPGRCAPELPPSSGSPRAGTREPPAHVPAADTTGRAASGERLPPPAVRPDRHSAARVRGSGPEPRVGDRGARNRGSSRALRGWAGPAPGPGWGRPVPRRVLRASTVSAHGGGPDSSCPTTDRLNELRASGEPRPRCCWRGRCWKATPAGRGEGSAEPRASPRAAGWSPGAPWEPQSRGHRAAAGGSAQAEAGRTGRAAGTRSQSQCSALAWRPKGHPPTRTLAGRRRAEALRRRSLGRARASGRAIRATGLPASSISEGLADALTK
uniref:Paraneoplastic antigen Ma-like N-terminal domain-containing protein n=1 Tax=Neovison vison TaxID=452646 RepID=A0A8C7AU77_NEOVI